MAAATSSEMRSPNVTVTPINVDSPYPQSQLMNCGVLVSRDIETDPMQSTLSNGVECGDLLDSSDVEVAQISVNMRHKKGRNNAEDMPRPMSWEGELSDHEKDMCIDANDEEDDGDGADNEDDDEDRVTHCEKHMCQVPENLTLPNSNNNNNNNELQNAFLTTSDHSKDDGFSTLRVKPTQQLQQQQLPSATKSNSTYSLHNSPCDSPLLSQRNPLSVLVHKDYLHKDIMHKLNIPPTPSPDSAIHSAYSVFSSPTQSPLTQRHINITPNLSRNNSDASHSSCCSYSSVSVSVSPTQQFSPNHSPIQGRHVHSLHNSPLNNPNVLYRNLPDDTNTIPSVTYGNSDVDLVLNEDGSTEDKSGLMNSSLPTQSGGISRQQLINSPCPICGDKISGFHYGIFSCESCKGFFKRTVQNRKNYVCLRGANCPVTVTTRKKCPACRFDKCLQCGMKLEAIREDRTRGGRSTYQCSYSLPPSLTTGQNAANSNVTEMRLQQSQLDGATNRHHHHHHHHHNNNHNHVGGLTTVKLEPNDMAAAASAAPHHHYKRGTNANCGQNSLKSVPILLQDIMNVEHLWHFNEMELHKLSTVNGGGCGGGGSGTGGSMTTIQQNLSNHPLLAGTALADTADSSPDFVANLCNIADRRLYKIVKWCKSLPLFKNISIDDQISLLINSWCELLLFSCCFRSISTPGEIRISLGKSITLNQAREMGMQACIERMLNFTEHLRRLRVDQYEYVTMKVIVLLTSDTSELKEAEKVRASQEKALKALQDYTLSHYPDSPAKFGELLLRIPELQRTCQVGKEMLTIKSKNNEGPSFNLLMELLRGDH